MINKMVEY